MAGTPPTRRAETACPQLLDMRGHPPDRRADGFSQGERMKTALARALVHDPPTSCCIESRQRPRTLATQVCAKPCAGCAAPRAAARCIVSPRTSAQEVELLCDEVVVISTAKAWRAAACLSCSTWRAPRAEDACRDAGFPHTAGGRMNQALIVFFKELRDAVRDHRTAASGPTCAADRPADAGRDLEPDREL